MTCVDVIADASITEAMCTCRLKRDAVDQDPLYGLQVMMGSLQAARSHGGVDDIVHCYLCVYCT